MVEVMRPSIFMIDPPWPKQKGGKRKGHPHEGKNLDYPTMPVKDIFMLLDAEVLKSAAPQHTVFLWTIDSFLWQAEQAMEHRGYRRHARFIWDKRRGVAPAFTVCYTHEYLLWYYKPKLMPIARDLRGKYPTVFRCAGREHSRKPDMAYDMVRALYPDAVRMDVFSREPRDGWLQWGNQTNHFALNTPPLHTPKRSHIPRAYEPVTTLWAVS